MTTIELIRAEIERRKKENMYVDLLISIGRYYEDRDLLSFLDTIPDEPVSDDEKIRKEIIHYILYEAKGVSEEQEHAWIAYLEKQKEIPMPNSTELIEMWHNEKAMLKEKDFRGDAWRLAQNSFMIGFARGTCVKSERQKEQKIAEWSKEETKDLVHILKVLDDCYAYGKHDLSKTDHDNLTSTIKSLCPSWKPSEELMGCFERLIAFKNPAQEDIDGCEELYEQLKKLM